MVMIEAYLAQFGPEFSLLSMTLTGKVEAARLRLPETAQRTQCGR